MALLIGDPSRRARIASVPEAKLEDFGSGLTPVTQGWFVVNVRDAEWWFSERRGARCAFENEAGGTVRFVSRRSQFQVAGAPVSAGSDSSRDHSCHEPR